MAKKKAKKTENVETKPARKRHTPEFKQQAVQAFENRGDKTVADIAGELGIPPNMLYAWAQKMKENGTPKSAAKAPKTSSAPARESGGNSEELRRLRAEVAELQRDKATLIASLKMFVK